MNKLKLLPIVLALLFSCTQSNEVKAKKPNVLFILVDDLGWRDVGCFGSTFYESPNVDKFGVRRGHIYQCLCSLPRMLSHTGKHYVG